MFIWEGVRYYLDTKSIDSTLKFVSQSSNKHSIIAFDYTTSLTKESISNYYGAKEFTQSMKKYHANEKLIFSIEAGKIESFLEQRYLRMVNHLCGKDIEKKFIK